jgi:hypothetical protein
MPPIRHPTTLDTATSVELSKVASRYIRLPPLALLFESGRVQYPIELRLHPNQGVKLK